MKALTLLPKSGLDRHRKIAETIKVYSQYARGQVRMSFGYVAPDEEARQVTNGPMVPGPWIYGFPLPLFIDNYGGSAAESQRLREQGLEFDAEIGDQFQIDGSVYELVDDERWSYPDLKLVSFGQPTHPDVLVRKVDVERMLHGMGAVVEENRGITPEYVLIALAEELADMEGHEEATEYEIDRRNSVG